jgi:hypothetical protein
MRVADVLVGLSIRCASTFERYRVVDVYRLYRRPFSFPQSHYHPAKGDVRFCIHLSAEAGFFQAVSDRVRALCSPAS